MEKSNLIPAQRFQYLGMEFSLGQHMVFSSVGQMSRSAGADPANPTDRESHSSEMGHAYRENDVSFDTDPTGAPQHAANTISKGNGTLIGGTDKRSSSRRGRPCKH